MAIRIFVDTDVVISSFISPHGAAFLLLNQSDEVELYVSNISVDEIEKVIKRLNLDLKKEKHLLGKRFSTLQLKKTIEEIKVVFTNYVLDPADSHVIAGAKAGQVQFIISYNIKHFKIDKIKEDFNIIVTTPANLLQYLRSQ